MAEDILSNDGAAVWARMNAVYAGFLAHDARAVDAIMHPDVTIWDSAESALVRGVPALQALRARRPTGDGPQVTDIVAREPVVDVWGDTALLRHQLRVSFTGGEVDQVVRNTSVWRRVQGEWFAVHNHEDVL